MDRIFEEYKKDVDRTLLRRALRMTFEERLERLQQMALFREELIAAKKKATRKQDVPR